MPSPEHFGHDLLQDLRAAWSRHEHDPRRAFAFRLASHYYGLVSGQGMTLENVGALDEVQLTRERVRQIIDSGVQCLRTVEKPLGKAVAVRHAEDPEPRPYARAAAWFHQLSKDRKSMFVALNDLLEQPYFAGFAGNHKGAIALLNDAGIRQVMYRNQHYLYPEGHPRKEAIGAVQAANKRLRHARTLRKMLDMSKTVTWVPVPTRSALKVIADGQDVGLNRLYERILVAFQEDAPYRPKASTTGKPRRPRAGTAEALGAWECFAKTTAWRSRNGKATEAQVGIYIKKDIADQAKKEARHHGTSFMSYIRCAFVWFVDDLTPERQAAIAREEPALEKAA